MSVMTHDDTLAARCNDLLAKRDYAGALPLLLQLHVQNKQNAVLGNIGICHRMLGNDDEALVCFEKVLAQDPNQVEILFHLDMLLIARGEYEQAIAALTLGLENPALDDYFRARIITSRALCHMLLGNFAALDEDTALVTEHLLRFRGQRPNRADLINMLQYYNFLKPLSAYIAIHPEYYTPQPAQTIYVLGDSHTLSLAHIHDNGFYFSPLLVVGVKVWHLGHPERNNFQRNFEAMLEKIPHGSTVIITAGEIDCRPNEGFMPYHEKNPDKPLEPVIATAVKNYVAYVLALAEKRQLKPIFLSVPLLNPAWLNRRDGRPSLTPEKAEACRMIIRLFNQQLAQHAPCVADSTPFAAGADAHIDLAHLWPDILCKAVFASNALSA